MARVSSFLRNPFLGERQTFAEALAEFEHALEALELGGKEDDNTDKTKKDNGVASPTLNEVVRLVMAGVIAFERDDKRNEEDEVSTLPEDQNLVSNAVQQLLDSDPEFADAFHAAWKGGLKINFRYNADESRVEVANGKVLMVDIKPGDDIKAKLKEFFNAGTHYETSAPKGNRSAKEVASDSSLTGEEMVAELEDMNVFDFSGPHADKIRKDIAEMFDKSPFNRAALAHALEKHPDRTWAFSTIGHGGGTVSEPLDNHANVVVTADDGYQSNLRLWSHEFHHASLDVPDDARIQVADGIYNNEQGNDTSGDAVKADPKTFSHLDMNKFFDVIDSLEGKGGDDIPTTDEIIARSLVPEDQLTPGTPKQAFEDALNGLVVEYHSAFMANDGAMLKNRSVPLSESIAEKYKTIVNYYKFIDPKGSKEDAAKWAFEQVKGRLPGVFPDGELTPDGRDNTIVDQKDNGAYANNILDGWFKRNGLQYITDTAS